MAEAQELSTNVAQLKSDLVNPKAISKKHDPLRRSALAGAILQTKREGRSIRDNLTAKEQEREGLVSQFDDTYLQEQQTARDLAQRQSEIMYRIKSKLGISDAKASQLTAQIHTLQTNRFNYSDQAAKAADEAIDLKEQQAKIPDPREMLEAYYEKMKTQPLTNKEKRELLVPEILANLTTDEYIALWRRLNPYFLSHVTRQGFRDHNAMVYHSGGLQDFHNGFVEVVEDEKIIRPPFALRGLKTRDQASIQAYLDDWVLKAANQEEAQERFDALLHRTIAQAPNYPDKTAVHFAAQVVASDYYGGENDNEVLFLYPTDVIASQYNFAFNGWGKDFTHPQNERK